jgi:hypothetical protein
MVCRQFGEKVVNACSRAHLHRPNDADVDPPPMLFVHITHFASRTKSPLLRVAAVALDVSLPQ